MKRIFMKTVAHEGLGSISNDCDHEHHNSDVGTELKSDIGVAAVSLFEKLASPNEDNEVVNAGVTRVITRVNGGGTVPDA